MRHVLSAVASTALLLIPALATADTFVFNPVDSVFLGQPGGGDRAVEVTGLTGSGESTTIVLMAFDVGGDMERDRIEGCYRQAVIAMNKPGRWRFTAIARRMSTGENRYYIQRCGLTRID
jgi:hypothetical protein